MGKSLWRTLYMNVFLKRALFMYNYFICMHGIPDWVHNNQYDALIGDGRAGVEAPSCERGVHVRTCRCTPHLTCVSVLSNGSLAAHQVQTQSAQQFARYGKRVCTCARADATHPDLCKARIYWAPSHTQNLNAILPAVCEIWKRGVHVRTC